MPMPGVGRGRGPYSFSGRRATRESLLLLLELGNTIGNWVTLGHSLAQVGPKSQSKSGDLLSMVYIRLTGKGFWYGIKFME